ncbi:hypothetical protein [Pseudomonas chlororaphis]
MNGLKNAIRGVQLPRIKSLINGCIERRLDGVPYDGYFYGVAFGVISTLADAEVISLEEYRDLKQQLIEACGREHPHI